MPKRILKNFIVIFTIITIFTLSIINNALAVADYPFPTTYSVRKGPDGENQFTSSLPPLSPWIFNGANTSPETCYINPDAASCDVGGDLAIELGNPFCVAYLVAYGAVMYAGNAAIKLTATTALLLMASVIYGIAAFKHNDFEICGADWLVWGNSSPAEISALRSFNEYYPELGAFGGSRRYAVIQCAKNFSSCIRQCQVEPTKCLLDLAFISREARTYLTINDKVFRERLYDGEEIENKNCLDPREEAKNYDVNQKRKAEGKLPYQSYYMRGFAPGNYACNRFLVGKKTDGDQFDEAYKCCVKASKSVCIRDKAFNSIESGNPFARFCNVEEDKRCIVSDIVLEIFKAQQGDTNQYCAKTWSLCPYNFNIQRGTERILWFSKTYQENEVTRNGQRVKEITVNDECYDDARGTALSCQGKIKNFYQYNRHCTLINEWVSMPEDSTYYSPYIDKACINFIGSSHNTVGYVPYKGHERMFDTYKSFTAPAAECITETLKNFLFNRAGHTKCLAGASNPNSKPDKDGICNDGYEYTEGDNLTEVKNIESYTSKLLSRIRTLIMLAVTLMITLFGYNILVNSGKLGRKDMMIMMLKVVIVITFSASDWWYNQLYRFTYGFSNTFSTITAKIGFDDATDQYGNYVKYDGCYFGDINNILGATSFDSIPSIDGNNYYLYPVNRRYIAFFDSLDCKITRYLGYGIGINVPSLFAFLGVSLIWPFNWGIYLGVASLMLALFVINFAIKAVYIFIASSIGIAIMLYVSPIMIPCILFKKTKDIFDKWLKSLISFCLQPMVMFAFVGMSLTIMDKYTLGEGIYSGKGINKELICGYACVDGITNALINYTSERSGSSYSQFSADCGSENKVLDIKRNSVICVFDSAVVSSWSVLQPLGLFLPLLMDIQLSDVIMFLRVAFLFFILTKVLETVPAIASNLTGGEGLPGTKHGDPFAGARKLADFTKTVKRGTVFAGKKAYGLAKEAAGSIRDKARGYGGDSGGNSGGESPSSPSTGGGSNGSNSSGGGGGSGSSSGGSGGNSGGGGTQGTI